MLFSIELPADPAGSAARSDARSASAQLDAVELARMGRPRCGACPHFWNFHLPITTAFTTCSPGVIGVRSPLTANASS